MQVKPGRGRVSRMTLATLAAGQQELMNANNELLGAIIDRDNGAHEQAADKFIAARASAGRAFPPHKGCLGIGVRPVRTSTRAG